MQIIKTDAFVLKSFKYGESSKIVTLFTKDYGKMNAMVKGVRNYKSRICGTMESMNYITAVIYLKENRELQLISNAEYKRSFPGIINDFNKLEIAFKIIELLNRSLTENYINKHIFELLLKVFTGLEKAEKSYYNFILFFLINLSKILGIVPEFSKEYSENETFFNLNEFYINRKNFDTLYLFNIRPIESIECINSEFDTLNELINNFERFVAMHTQGESNFKSTKVFKQLNTNN